MHSETWNGHRIVVIDIDGQKSDPITPLTPKEKEHVDRLRERYIKAGLIKQTAKASSELSIETKQAS